MWVGLCEHVLLRHYFKRLYMLFVALWLGYWSQDQKVWGSIPTADHV